MRGTGAGRVCFEGKAEVRKRNGKQVNVWIMFYKNDIEKKHIGLSTEDGVEGTEVTNR